MIPSWADGPSDLVRFIREAHQKHLNLSTVGGLGEGIHIGLIDSGYSLPEALTEGHDVNCDPRNAFIDAGEEDTSGHCENVFVRVASFSPDAEITLYQAVNEEGKLPLGAFSDACTAAIQDDVDLLNISAGDPWRGPVNACPSVGEVKRVIDDGIPVIAAAGNWYPDSDESKPPVHCPAAHEDVIAVGGLETVCPAAPGDEPDEDDRGPYYAIPDNDEETGLMTPVEAYCGSRKCVDNGDCIQKQIEREWEYNPLPTNNKPDTLAPMHLLQTDSDDDSDLLKLIAGSSFAAPIVTASIANILSELKKQDAEIPSPFEIREAVRTTTAPVVQGNSGRYDAWRLRKELTDDSSPAL